MQELISEPKYDFSISAEQLAKAKQQVDQKLLNETLFIIPNNDGEAVRAGAILEALEAPHFQQSAQGWGATLANEPLDQAKLSGVKRVVVFEIPGLEVEEKLRKQGLEVVVVDHHAYKDIDRRRQESSLEQLMSLINWPMSRVDEALAVNDRGYIPGLKKMGLSEDEIREIRSYDLLSQGKSKNEIMKETEKSRALIPSLPQKNGIYILKKVSVDEGILKQELAIKSKDGLSSALEINDSKVGFTGNPGITKKLLNYNFEELGYDPGSFAKYGGGDPEASMFFGFKPTKPPVGETELLPKKVLEKIENLIFGEPARVSAIGTVFDSEVKAAGMLPRGSAIVTSSGDLSNKGIKHIIHAATGSMTRGGPKFDPTEKGVIDAVQNSLDLARQHGDKRVAVPFIGGKIFVDRIGVSPQALADRIVETAIKNRGDLELRFVTFGDEDTQLFNNSLAKYGASLNATQATVVSGSITDYSLHGASAIINAANMEVQFGGGLSGVIGRATGMSDKIDKESQEAIKNFYK
jgi:O-acetyl-ADP-ribose deacetylase (regulator of RNase III)